LTNKILTQKVINVDHWKENIQENKAATQTKPDSAIRVQSRFGSEKIDTVGSPYCPGIMLKNGQIQICAITARLKKVKLNIW
jgi:hypothetical protein